MKEVFLNSELGAPALARGLYLLRLLEHRDPVSLEVLAAEAGLPKASAFRLLDTLVRLNFVEKNQKKQYRSLWALRSMEDPEELFQSCLWNVLYQLRTDCGATVEWYQPSFNGMILRMRSEAQGELDVRARVGFLRDWIQELDSVCALGYALAEEAPSSLAMGMSAYLENGKQGPLDLKEGEQRVAAAKAQHQSSDPFYNLNSVKRYARAIFREGTFCGVLAIASAYRFSETPKSDFYFTALERAAVRLQELSSVS